MAYRLGSSFALAWLAIPARRLPSGDLLFRLVVYLRVAYRYGMIIHGISFRGTYCRARYRRVHRRAVRGYSKFIKVWESGSNIAANRFATRYRELVKHGDIVSTVSQFSMYRI